MHCSKFIGETPTFFLILSSLKGANLALQQPMQHRYRLQRDPRAHRAFIHVEYGHHRSHKQGLHSHKLVPLSKRRIGRLCADTSGNKLFCFLKAQASSNICYQSWSFFLSESEAYQIAVGQSQVKHEGLLWPQMTVEVSTASTLFVGGEMDLLILQKSQALCNNLKK